MVQVVPRYEFPNEMNQALKHNKKGMVSMANAGTDTDGSYFYHIKSYLLALWRNTSFLQMLVYGFEVIDGLASLRTDVADKPIEKVNLQKISIFRKGKEYKDYDPEKIFYEKMDSIQNA